MYVGVRIRIPPAGHVNHHSRKGTRISILMTPLNLQISAPRLFEKDVIPMMLNVSITRQRERALMTVVVEAVRILRQVIHCTM